MYQYLRVKEYENKTVHWCACRYGECTCCKFGVAVDVNFGKWITPTIGGRLGWKGINDKVGVKDGYSVVDEKFSYNTVHADLLWNVSNAFGGYKETRTWNVILYPSVSFIHASGNNELGAGAGMLNNFRLSDRVNLFVDLSVMGTKAGISRVEPLPSRFGFVPSARRGFQFVLLHQSVYL